MLLPYLAFLVDEQDLKYRGGVCHLVIGDRNDIREFVQARHARLRHSRCATVCVPQIPSQSPWLDRGASNGLLFTV